MKKKLLLLILIVLNLKQTKYPLWRKCLSRKISGDQRKTRWRRILCISLLNNEDWATHSKPILLLIGVANIIMEKLLLAKETVVLLFYLNRTLLQNHLLNWVIRNHKLGLRVLKKKIILVPWQSLCKFQI